jgi:hypothetical protein
MARAAGKHFHDFNREQQAQIAQDYYNDKHGNRTEWGGTVATLQPSSTRCARATSAVEGGVTPRR